MYVFLFFYKGIYKKYISFVTGMVTSIVIFVPALALIMDPKSNILMLLSSIILMVTLIIVHLTGPIWSMIDDGIGPLNIISFIMPGMGAGVFNMKLVDTVFS
jgi:hypothetical protein